MKSVLLVITGSIAAYKSLDLARNLESNGYNVNVVLTPAALEFVTKNAFKALIKGNIYSLEEYDEYNKILHTKLAKHDLIVIAPATYNIIGKFVSGVSDELALDTLAASNAHKIFVPAMNVNMYLNPINQENIKKVKALGYEVIEPESGELACGDIGVGKMAHIDIIVKKVNEYFNRTQLLKGKKIILTVGSTREYIDPVRFISNESSGEQGVLIANELIKQGAEVIAVASYIDPKYQFANGVKIVNAYNADQIFAETEKNLPADCFIGVAAVADYKPKEIKDKKMKKTNDEIVVELTKTIDVLKTVASHEKRPKVVVGFSLETNDYIDHAKEKFNKKKLDLIIANCRLDGTMNYAVYNGSKVDEFGPNTKEFIAKYIANFLINKFS